MAKKKEVTGVKIAAGPYIPESNTKKVSETIVSKPDLSGWNSEKEVGETLASIIKMTGAKNVLEVGTFEGQTSKYIFDALGKDSYFASIDITDYRTDQNKKIFEPGKKVADFILGDSLTELPKRKEKLFDLIYVDSAHHWEHILPEFKALEPLLAEGGTIVYHDANEAHEGDVYQLTQYISTWYNVVILNTPHNRGLAIINKK